MNAHSHPETAERKRRQTVLELHHAWLRLEAAQVEIQWAGASCASGQLPPESALAILEDELDKLADAAP